MGEVIKANAKVASIEADVREALTNALARGGDVAEAAKHRLSAVVAGVDAAVAHLKASEDVEATGWALILAEDNRADRGIGAVRDVMWNELGRPRQSAALDQVFPGGVGTYTSGKPENQPVLMQVLRSRILASAAPQWTEAQRTGWAAEIEALRATYDAAIVAWRPTEAGLTVADASYRSAIRAAHARLVAFKRDLLSLGLSESQIHEIIPDASSRGGRTGKPSGEGGTGSAP